MWNGQHPYKRLHWKVTNSIHSRWWKSSKTSFYKLKAFHKIFAVFMINVTEHHVTMPRARNQEVLQKCSCAQATIEWTWSNGNPYCCLSVALVDSAFFLLRVRSSHKKPQLNSWHSEMRVYRAFALSPGITITSSFWANSMNLYGPWCSPWTTWYGWRRSLTSALTSPTVTLTFRKGQKQKRFCNGVSRSGFHFNRWYK